MAELSKITLAGNVYKIVAQNVTLSISKGRNGTEKSLELDVHLHVKLVGGKNPLKGKTVSKSKGRLRGEIVAKIHENVTKYIV